MIRKYLASDVVEPKCPARKSTRKLDPYAEMLASWLTREAKRNRKRRRKARRGAYVPLTFAPGEAFSSTGARAGSSSGGREFGISRNTGYKIFNRYKDTGLDGLTDRSRRPYPHANQLPFQIENEIVRVKR